MTNAQVCQILQEIGELLELKGETPFKSRAYFNAVQTIQALDTPLEDVVKAGQLSQLKGFGKALTQKITELVESGKLGYYEKLKQSVPPGLFAIAALPGLDRRKTGLLYLKLGVTSLEALAQACREDRVSEIRGFNQESQRQLLLEIQRVLEQG